MRLFIALILIIFTSQAAAANIYDLIEFRSELAPESTLSNPLKTWSEAEKEIVIKQFKSLQQSAPGLLLRAAAPGKIMLYRATSSPSHPSGAWVRRRHESSFIFTDIYFAGAGKNHLGIIYTDWLFIHEISHLADPVDQIARSDEWSEIIEGRLLSVSRRLNQQGLSLRQAMFKRLDSEAQPYGFPSIYAAISRHEALAEFSAAYQFGKPVPHEIQLFLQSRLYNKPKPEATEIARLYREANIEFRNEKYKKAIKTLTKSIKIAPDFSQGWYLRGFANLNAKKFRKAQKDFKEALSLIPMDDRKMRRESLEARIWANNSLKDFASTVSDYSELISQDQKQSKYYYGRGVAYIKQDKLALAKTDLQSALQLNPNNRDNITDLLQQINMRLNQ